MGDQVRGLTQMDEMNYLITKELKGVVRIQ
jgi:hypothetical protein